MHFPTPLRNRRNGFTLVELLVVIAIISVLAAMLFPALDLMRKRSRQLGCLSNKRQIALAALMYAGENGSRFPTITNAWYGCIEHLVPTGYTALFPYGASFNLLACPNVPDSEGVTFTMGSQPFPTLYSRGTALWYGGSGRWWLDWSGAVSEQTPGFYQSTPFTERLDDSTHPARLVIVSDINDCYVDGTVFNRMGHPVTSSYAWVSSKTYDSLESFKADTWGSNEIFADGHGQFTPKSQMDFDGSAIMQFWYLKTMP